MSKLAPTTGAYLYLHADGLGSVRVATSATGTTQDTCDYDAFGAGYAGDPPCLAAAAFAGQARDGETGLYHLRARQYDPGTGRFTQADPIGYGGGGNQYAYAGSNPGTLTDPSGLCPICVGAVGGGLAGLGAYALSHRGRFDGGEAARWTAAGALAGGTLGVAVEAAGAYGFFGVAAAEAEGASLAAMRAKGSSELIGVPERPFARASARLIGLRVGDQPVIQGIDAFGSRAGSVYRGRGPSPKSDLDLLLTVNQRLMQSRSGPWIARVLNQIGADFEREAGFPLSLHRPDSAIVFRSGIEGSPWIRLFER